jgi:peptide/nickel transport system permease protein
MRMGDQAMPAPLGGQMAEPRSPGTHELALRRLLRHRLGRIGLVVVLLLLIIALAAPLLAPYDPTAQDYDAMLDAPSWVHPFGTDDIGRDILSRVIFGMRVSLEVIGVSGSVALAFGSGLGLITGYFGGWVDHVVMRVMDGLLAFPMLVLALAVIAVLGPNLMNAIVAIGIVNIPGFVRLVRGQVLTVRRLDYVQAARALGASDWRIITFHIWPKVAGHVIVYGSLRASAALITESSLAFLGLGAQPPTPSWGSMLADSMQHWDAWWMGLFPGVAIFIAVLSLNFLGDGLRDALDVRIQG